MFTKQFWVDALERAIKTGAQVLAVTWLVAGQAVEAFSLDYKLGASLFFGGMLASVITSVASSQIGPEKGTPSLVVPAEPKA